MTRESAAGRGTAIVPRTASAGGATAHSARVEAIGVEIREGQYWRYDGAEPLIEGTDTVLAAPGEVLLVVDVKIHHANVHTVKLRVHPTRTYKGNARVFALRADELVARWSHAEDGRTLRKREIEAIERRIDDRELALAQLRRTGDTLQIEWTAQANAGRAMEAVRERTRAIAGHRNALLAASARVNEAVAELLPYDAERIEAAKLGHAQALAEVDDLTRAAQILELYAGTNVEVEHWSAPTARTAPPDTPITVYQRTRYIDEESLYHILDGGGGADVTDTESYIQALASDRTMRDRVVPALRSVVAVQPRRTSKRYADIGDALARGKADRTTFVLIRNGERYTSVHWEMGEWARLVPRRDTWASLFKERRGWRTHESEDPRWIGPDDVRFVDTLERAEAQMREYLTAWVVIAGVHLRESVFGPLEAEAALGRPLNLMVPHEHDRIVEVVRDEEDALGIGLEPWIEFLRRTNARARPGGRAVVAVHDAINPDQTDWYSARELRDTDNDRPRARARPQGDVPLVLAVRERHGHLTVRCPTTRGRSRDIVLLDHARWWLWLEDTCEKRLKLHLDHDRESYREIAPLALPGIARIEADNAADTARASREEPGRTATAIEAYRIWRSLHGGAPPGPRKARAVMAHIEGVRSHARAVEQALAPEALIEIAIETHGAPAAYTLAEGEGASAGGQRWARRSTVHFERNGALARIDTDPALTITRRGPAIIRAMASDDPRAQAVDGHARRIAWTEAQRMHDAVRRACAGIGPWTARLHTNRATAERIAQTAIELAHTQHRHIESTGALRWAVAVVARTEVETGDYETGMLCIQANALELLASTLGPEIKGTLYAALNRIYRYPERKLRDYTEHRRKPHEHGVWRVSVAAGPEPAQPWAPQALDPRKGHAVVLPGQSQRASHRRRGPAVDSPRRVAGPGHGALHRHPLASGRPPRRRPRPSRNRHCTRRRTETESAARRATTRAPQTLTPTGRRIPTMAELHRYVLVDEDGHEDSDEYEHLGEACTTADRASTPSAVIRRIYRLDDTEVVQRPYPSEFWPPTEKAQELCGSCWGTGDDSETG